MASDLTDEERLARFIKELEKNTNCWGKETPGTVIQEEPPRHNPEEPTRETAPPTDSFWKEDFEPVEEPEDEDPDSLRLQRQFAQEKGYK